MRLQLEKNAVRQVRSYAIVLRLSWALSGTGLRMSQAMFGTGLHMSYAASHQRVVVLVCYWPAHVVCSVPN